MYLVVYAYKACSACLKHIMSRGLSKGESQIPTVMILSQIVHLVCTRKFNSGMAIMKNWLWKEAYLPEELSFYFFLE